MSGSKSEPRVDLGPTRGGACRRVLVACGCVRVRIEVRERGRSAQRTRRVGRVRGQVMRDNHICLGDNGDDIPCDACREEAFWREYDRAESLAQAEAEMQDALEHSHG